MEHSLLTELFHTLVYTELLARYKNLVRHLANNEIKDELLLPIKKNIAELVLLLWHVRVKRLKRKRKQNSTVIIFIENLN